ncbi:MAG: lipocalin-like domain-containing protein [Sphingomonadaceae bacterium]
MTITSRRSWLKSLLVSGVLLQAVPAAAAETGNRLAAPPLVGTWRLVSYELRNGKGEVIHPMGRSAQGQIIYDGAGNMSCHLVNPNPPARPPAVEDGATYEARISYDRYSSYFGSYEVDLAKQEVRHHVLGASMPNWAGTTVVRSYAFEGEDGLTLSAGTGAGDQRAILKWRRAR